MVLFYIFPSLYYEFPVAVKTLIIGDNHEGCKKGKQDNWLFNKKLSSAIPCNDIIACLMNFVVYRFSFLLFLVKYEKYGTPLSIAHINKTRKRRTPKQP